MNFNIKDIKKFLLTPGVCWCIFTLFIIIYLIVLYKEGAFESKKDQDGNKKSGFLHFGPDDINFFNMKLDTWPKVISVYAIGFFSVFISEYYRLIIKDKLDTKIWNPAFKTKIGVSKFWTYLVSITEPALWWSFRITTFALFMLRKLQFLIPILLGEMAFQVPYIVYKLRQKKF